MTYTRSPQVHVRECWWNVRGWSCWWSAEVEDPLDGHLGISDLAIAEEALLDDSDSGSILRDLRHRGKQLHRGEVRALRCERGPDAEGRRAAKDVPSRRDATDVFEH